MVELAFVLPVLLAIVLLGIDFGRAWNNKNNAVHLANEVVRMAAVGSVDCPTVSTEATADGLAAVGAGASNTQVSWTTASTTGGPSTSPPNWVKATVTIPFSSILPTNIPGFGSLPLIPKTLTGTATMHTEANVTGSSC